MRKLVLLLLFFCLLSFGVVLGIIIQPLFNGQTNKNVVNDPAIFWSNEWHNVTREKKNVMETSYPASEFSFAFKGSKSLGFHVETQDQLTPTELVINLDGKTYDLVNPNINNKRLFIITDTAEHHVNGTVYCLSGLAPCKIHLTEIILEGGEVLTWEDGKKPKTLGVLGDSISLIGLQNNYTAVLARNLRLHIHNASLWGRTAANEKGKLSAISLYKKDLTKYKPDIVLLFLGINDIDYGTSSEAFEHDYEELLIGVKRDLPNAKIITVSILPSQQIEVSSDRISVFNQAIKMLSERHSSEFVDITDILNEEDYGDPLHPNEKGEAKIAERLSFILKDK